MCTASLTIGEKTAVIIYERIDDPHELKACSLADALDSNEPDIVVIFFDRSNFTGKTRLVMEYFCSKHDLLVHVTDAISLVFDSDVVVGKAY